MNYNVIKYDYPPPKLKTFNFDMSSMYPSVVNFTVRVSKDKNEPDVISTNIKWDNE